ncbi:MAG TPA: hypothetical protein VHD38_00270, partial [Candidatus Paceibacterota bacterium]|nr:hypothetical protein [Candidatus Paceibacterota bacterium]
YAPASTITTGSGQTVGTFTIAGDAQGATIASMPVTVSATGAAATNLTNCQLYNQNGQALGTSFNPTGSTGTFNFTSPLAIGGTTATSTVSVRCDVAAGTPSNSVFQFVAGAPMYGNGLAVNFLTVPTVPAGSANEALGIISLDATRSGSAVTVTSLPISISPNGASISALSNCSLRNITNLTTPIPATATQNGSVMTFGLTNPLVIPAGTMTSLAIVCNIDPSTPMGSSFAVSLTPSQIVATASGATVTPAGALGSTGSALPTSGTVTVGVPNTGSTGGTTGTPGSPNTGAGGNAFASVLMLAFAGLLAVAGSMYLGRRAA